MLTLPHRFKHIVTALVLSVGFSLPAPLFAQTQDSRLDELYQQLLEADEGNYERIATSIYEEWGKSGSPSMDLLVKRGRDALDAGDPQAALDHFSALVDHAPDFAEGYAGRATAYYLLDMVGPALDDIRQTLVLNPRHFGAMRGFGIILEELDRPEEALEVYRQVLVIDPFSPDVKDAISRLELQFEGQTL
jgi:tetratricopeptide (TPR) repeat protein